MWGEAPCNDFQAEYVFDGTRITLSYLSQSAVLCLDERGDQDEILLEMFRRGNIEVTGVGDGSRLEWTFPGGHALLSRFEGNWRLGE